MSPSYRKSKNFLVKDLSINYSLDGDFRVSHNNNILVSINENILTIGSSWYRLNSISRIKKINSVLLDDFRVIKLKNKNYNARLICPFGEVDFSFQISIDIKSGKVYSKI